jgi:tetratricopeptide (TPR) repeat protein
MSSWWSRIFGKTNSLVRPAVAHTPQQAGPWQSPSPLPARGSPSHACLRWGMLTELPAPRPACSHSAPEPSDAPEWFTLLQAQVTAVQANDTAVRLFREGRLDDAIAVLRRGLKINPQHATGYSNLGFLLLRRGQLDEAVECLLRALEVEPLHKDAPDHLFDVLCALIDELGQIGLTDGFLAMQPGRKFDEYNRHMRAREIGELIAKIGAKRIFKADDRVLASDLLLGVVINAVQQKMGYRNTSTNLTFAWQGMRGWPPPNQSVIVWHR